MSPAEACWGTHHLNNRQESHHMKTTHAQEQIAARADNTKLRQWNAAQTERDPHQKQQHEPGAKMDAGKQLAWTMVAGFGRALGEVAEVTTIGARKYSPDGWRSVPDGSARYMEAFARHTMALAGGEVRDYDTGCLHKAQMVWNLLASLELDLLAAHEGLTL